MTTLMRRGAMALTLALAVFPAACSDSSSPEGDVDAVVGTYALTTLRFDPQGTLPDQDIRAALGNAGTQLILTSDRSAQVVYRDPVSQLFVTVQGSFRISTQGVRIEWASNSQYRQLLLSRTMDYAFNPSAGTLTFDADAPDGALRARLQALVPAFQGEQLLDPTPGRLQVTFTRQ